MILLEQGWTAVMTDDASVCETSDLWGNLIAEAEAASDDGMVLCVVAFLGVLMGVPEVVECCDGDVVCHGGKGASEVAVVAEDDTVL